MEKRFYQLVDGSDEAELYIFGDISCYAADEYGQENGEQSGLTMARELQKITAPRITVRINSYGGHVSEGLAIHNLLTGCGKEITTVCEGFACSAASVVFMAGEKRIMRAASLLMIHNAQTVALGDPNDLRKAAEDLETVTSASKAAYMARVKISEEELTELMDNETWITPKEAVKMGFATEIQEEKPDGKATQSAMGLIMDRLTQQEGVCGTLEAAPCPDPREIADAVVEALAASEAFRSAVGLTSAALPGEPDDPGTEPAGADPAPDGWAEFWD